VCNIVKMTCTGWLLLLYALPTPRNAERVNLWRKLRKMGAVPLETSGYVLPDRPAHLERFQWLSKQLQDAGGQATLIRVAEIDGVSHEQVIELFNAARASDYKELAVACQEILGKRHKRPELEPELAKLKRRLNEIKEIDFFNSPSAYDAQLMLERLEKVLSPPNGVSPQRKLDPKKFVGRILLTRPRPGIDRAGSAWLIRRFIDPNAKFVFSMNPKKQPNALAFDMADVEFTHHGDDCTIETFIKRFGITDKAAIRISEMVHDADLEDDKFGRPECLGINRVLNGWARTDMSDEELLEKGIQCFEGLYKGLQT